MHFVREGAVYLVSNVLNFEDMISFFLYSDEDRIIIPAKSYEEARSIYKDHSQEIHQVSARKNSERTEEELSNVAQKDEDETVERTNLSHDFDQVATADAEETQ